MKDALFFEVEDALARLEEVAPDLPFEARLRIATRWLSPPHRKKRAAVRRRLMAANQLSALRWIRLSRAPKMGDEICAIVDAAVNATFLREGDLERFVTDAPRAYRARIEAILRKEVA